MAAILKWTFSGLAQSYGKILTNRLKTNGLKYDDLLIEACDVQKALARTDPSIRVLRDRRIKRAFDASGKKKTIPEEYHNYNPFELYLQPKVDLVKLEKLESILLK